MTEHRQGGDQQPSSFGPPPPVSFFHSRAWGVIVIALGATAIGVIATIGITQDSRLAVPPVPPAEPVASSSPTSSVLTSSVQAPAPAAPTTAGDPALDGQTPALVGESWTFTTPRGGDGRATLVDARWEDVSERVDGEPGLLPDNGAFLVLDVAVKMNTEVYRLAADRWTVVDADGRTWPCESSGLFDVESPDFPPLASAWNEATGVIACDVPRGPVTVLMEDTLDWTVEP